MKKNEIAIGQTYLAKVSNRIVPVRIDEEHPRSGWNATNLKTGKIVRIKSARKLRSVASQPEDTTRELASAIKSQSDTKPISKEPKTANISQSDTNQSKRFSLLNAAAIVLEACEGPLSCKEILQQAIDAGIWQPRRGKTPANTLSAAIRREIKTKGDSSRFQLVERGKFALK